jgi:lipase chaperone LimK
VETLPEEQRAARAATLLAATLQHDEEGLRARGASAAEVRSLRERLVGVAAADRLDALDRRRDAWQQRVDDYRTARTAIETDPRRTPAEREAAARALRDERFTGPERLRLEALERLVGR